MWSYRSLCLIFHERVSQRHFNNRILRNECNTFLHHAIGLRSFSFKKKKKTTTLIRSLYPMSDLLFVFLRVKPEYFFTCTNRILSLSKVFLSSFSGLDQNYYIFWYFQC